MKKILFLLLIFTIPTYAITLEEAKEAYNTARLTNSELKHIIQTKLAFSKAGFSNTFQLYDMIQSTHQAIIDEKLSAEGRSAVILFLDLLRDMTTMPSKQRDALILDIYGYHHKPMFTNIIKKWYYISDALTDVQEHAMMEYEEAKRLLNL